MWGDYSKGLPKRLSEFLRTCAREGYSVILPATALMEISRAQNKTVADSRQAVAQAIETLRTHAISCPEVDLEKLVKDIDVLAMMKSAYSNVVIVQASLEQYHEALRRACFHLSPQLSNAKSDEMRDLVIWITAVDLAKAEGGALLVSQDVVHSGKLGDEEAAGVGLVRAKNLDDALGVLGLHSSSGGLLSDLLAPSWAEFKKQGLPVEEQPSLRTVRRAAFVQGHYGAPGVATAEISLSGCDGQEIRADVDYRAEGESSLATVTLSSITCGDGKLERLAVTIPAPRVITPSQEHQDLEALRTLIGGS
ncbi:PIN domain-containing protein [Micropruina sonneratiae]|uniref:PIN domain-containing protein n=1 Tax=Micropruina sonneratiae TaxID=2986940 RepID=UPI0022279E94|nr:PIN domain-containing protein [Micropruina sp. KQZ13P-5]MCW3158897.1 hypothetical protein [Micropruina sp. KQZ13P-5]